MSESDIADLFPTMTLEDTLKKEVEVEDGTQTLENTSGKLKEEVEEDGTQEHNNSGKLKEEVSRGKLLKLNKRNKKGEEEEWRKYVGVMKSVGMFSAQIRYPDGHRVWLGTYKSPKVAALAYDKAAFKLYGPQATLNFPDRIRTSDHGQTNK
ncbi:putative transcription factor AP2-EREBP family [Helianthus debilis subsp. tardiflorus]